MSEKSPLRPGLWTDQPVDDIRAVYADWAASYDADVGARGYHTPARIAEALRAALPVQTGPILDFGCGTGISGAALRLAGFDRLHGTDVTPEMLAQAAEKGLYEHTWLGAPGMVPARPGDYQAIVATGVVSLGAAPPETLDLLVDALAPGGLIALSFNDPSLEDGRYDARLDAQVDAGRVRLVSRAHGRHLDDLGMGADVIVLEVRAPR